MSNNLKCDTLLMLNILTNRPDYKAQTQISLLLIEQPD